MTYNVLDIAKYVVDYCTKQNKSISNLKLQKMLYYIWIDYYKRTNSYLFCEDICAWQFGPVVPDVYYEYCSYAGTPIVKEYDNILLLTPNILVDLNNIIELYINKTSTELVKMSHKIGYPWDIIYKNGLGNREIIPFDLIIEKECS